MIFWLSSFCGKSRNKNLYSEKTFFSYLMNWDLGYLQSSVDENKIAIRKISIRSIRKLSYFDQQTIVGGPHFNLTNGEISIIFSVFFVKYIFQIISPFCFNFDWFSNYFNQTYAFFHFLLIQINNGRTPFLLSPFGGFRLGTGEMRWRSGWGEGCMPWCAMAGRRGLRRRSTGI